MLPSPRAKTARPAPVSMISPGYRNWPRLRGTVAAEPRVLLMTDTAPIAALTRTSNNEVWAKAAVPTACHQSPIISRMHKFSIPGHCRFVLSRRILTVNTPSPTMEVYDEKGNPEGKILLRRDGAD